MAKPIRRRYISCRPCDSDGNYRWCSLRTSFDVDTLFDAEDREEEALISGLENRIGGTSEYSMPVNSHVHSRNWLRMPYGPMLRAAGSNDPTPKPSPSVHELHVHGGHKA